MLSQQQTQLAPLWIAYYSDTGSNQANWIVTIINVMVLDVLANWQSEQRLFSEKIGVKTSNDDVLVLRIN